ncbi:MAG: DEAD/DEAH box helicase [Chloroflexi bacterium]|nr:DEAD/DEAH box helicase [Chloroflexota bacterium]
MNVPEFLNYLRSQKEYREQIVHIEHLPARQARFGTPQHTLSPEITRALRETGIGQFYSHQAAAIDAALDGEDVMVATTTASGKTLCYNVPVLEAVIRDWHARALYLFPTKALAQDQLRSLQQLTRAALKHVGFGTYDGDTPQRARTRLRKSAAIILTNPDMLHVGILPNHGLWAKFLANLKYVVVDEAHVYRGIFGSHVACVLRRLRRLCEYYGSSPQFICCSATIANPAEHGEQLTGVPVTVIDADGSPHGAKDFVLWNPPFIDAARTTRRSPNVEATTLFTEMVRHGIRNITFTRTRKIAELILRYTREILEKDDPDLVSLIRSYRAGYRPEERREIERELFSGRLLGVTATNALELGVDVGSLDAAVLVGYPGTIASMRQQAGRAGRGVRHSLAVLIAQDSPIDQYFMRHPTELFGRPHEHALIDPDNVHLLEKHLPCAAYERPLTNDDEVLFGPGFVQAMIQLERNGTLEYRGERWYYSIPDYPAQRVSLRSASPEKYVLLDESDNYRTMEEIEGDTAFLRVYPGAIYLHQGETYLITHLDLSTRIAYASPTDVNYYTEPREINEVRVIRVERECKIGKTMAHFGQVAVTQQVIGFRRLQQFTDTVLSEEMLDLPPQSFVTTAVWFEVPEETRIAIAARGLDFHGGLHATEHAAIGMLPLFAMCDRLDIGGLSTPTHPDTGQPEIFIYDAHPGGVGIAEKGYELLPELWRATLVAIRDCPCTEGCPSCIQSPKCGNNNEPLDKGAAVMILSALLQGERNR